jgi:hypothetical protein
MMLLAFALIYAGCTALALAMNRHFQQVLPHRKAAVKTPLVLRSLGWLLLLAGTAYCIRISGVAVGLVAMFGLVSAAAALLAILLPYAPRLAVSIAVAAPLVGLAL